ncbi:gamma-glutamyltransferase family protein [Amycolatopsis sp. OK19-0408]|uniref:Gamma-glutamyltransferase family protein n=1 Tax=Amycolatopsis iheyensis TaxID=2945988 RepID=A0A9X2NA09_9PSEU|nr:gamma-glutamyltransferase family protein [Amycolatopsis iheyensis]MCR6482914.1 gamma-glutamyltransferase family protein [Amycolatopsis iheyensis]
MTTVVATGPGRVGPKEPVTGRRAVASSQHRIVTDTMLDTLRAGGNAVDAAIAGSLVQAVVQQDMTNHTGTVTALVHDAKTGEVAELNSMGTIVPGLPPFAPIPMGKGLYAAAPGTPRAVVPGFMPGMKALYERYATLPWARLCESAVHWAEAGHEVTSFEHLVMAQTVDFFLYTESGREHFTPDGHLPQVGDRWASPELAATMRALAAEGPDHFLTGQWARDFVARGNALGWGVKPEHLTAIPPRWSAGHRWEHKGATIVQQSAPERQGIYCQIVLGILDELDITSVGHWSANAEALYYLAHALRRATLETGILNDPGVFGDTTGPLTSPALIKGFAEILRNAKARVDLTEHVKLTRGAPAMAASGASKQPAGSCELTVVDEQGNWVQLMNTLQSGGIPGEVVGGVPMVGSHAMNSLASPIEGWVTGGGRMRSILSNTMVLRDGKPWLSLGSPGNVHCTVPQVLSNILDFGMTPYAADDAPRCLPYEDDHTISVESRVGPDVPAGLAKLGVLTNPLPAYDYHMGTYQMAWREAGGSLGTCTGPRREGVADGL